MELSLKSRLERFLKRKQDWFPKGTLCDIARTEVGATGEHTGRRLRELQNEGIVEVKYEHNHAYYRYNQHQPMTNEQLIAQF